MIVDLTPPAVGAATGPPRASFWSSPITLAHENAHVAHFYSPPFWEAFMRTAETTIEAPANNVNVDHTIPATMSEAAVITAAAAANQATIDAQHAAADAAEIGGSEVFAHGQSNPMYATLVAQIAARFRPLAPTTLAAVAAAGGVNLAWTHNACNDTEYRVYRRRGRGAFTRIATLPAGRPRSPTTWREWPLERTSRMWSRRQASPVNPLVRIRLLCTLRDPARVRGAHGLRSARCADRSGTARFGRGCVGAQGG